MSGLIRCLAVFVFFLTLGFGVSSRADMLVIESNVQEYPAGSHLPDDAEKWLRLGANCFIRVLILPSNATRIFEGPKSQRPKGGTRGLSRTEC
jgi:hypothetical protein